MATRVMPWSVTPAPVWVDNLIHFPESYPRAGNFAAVRDNHVMNAEIEKHLPEIQALCREYGVIRLELFGSATGSEFDPDRSDFDLIATFTDTPGLAFVRFADELEHIVGRPVDVMMNRPIRNPFLRREVEATRTVIVDAQVA
jgi:predicted nucleotidyltransferase